MGVFAEMGGGRVPGPTLRRCARRRLTTSGLCLLAGLAASLAFASTSAAKTVWLCKASSGACGKSLTTTIVQTNGSTSTEKSKKANKPAINCFYVYPTVSGQSTPNANLKIEKSETAVAEAQASRFSQDCAVYAPMYEQLTLKALLEPSTVTPEVEHRAYAGVLAAWEEFLSKYDKGKGVVLIGHSQGSLMLIQLIKEQIDPNPAERKLLVSALLLGGNVLVHKGERVGGDFENVPACEEASETGCVIAYSSFLKEPPLETIFGRPQSTLIKTPPPPETEVLCVNPALEVQSDSSAGALLPYAPTKAFPGSLKGFYGPLPTAKTPWVSSPGEYTAQCHNENGASWLQINPVGAAVDPSEYVKELLGPEWGLHLFDVNIALGNLVKTVATEASSYLH